MKEFIFVTLTMFSAATARTQQLAPSPSSSAAPVASQSNSAAAADVETLRQQVQALTETVKTLQQQVKDQQAAIEKATGAGASPPQNPEPSPIAAAVNLPSPAASAPARFPT